MFIGQLEFKYFRMIYEPGNHTLQLFYICQFSQKHQQAIQDRNPKLTQNVSDVKTGQ